MPSLLFESVFAELPVLKSLDQQGEETSLTVRPAWPWTFVRGAKFLWGVDIATMRGTKFFGVTSPQLP